MILNEIKNVTINIDLYPFSNKSIVMVVLSNITIGEIIRYLQNNLNININIDLGYNNKPIQNHIKISDLTDYKFRFILLNKKNLIIIIFFDNNTIR